MPQLPRAGEDFPTLEVFNPLGLGESDIMRWIYDLIELWYDGINTAWSVVS